LKKVAFIFPGQGSQSFGMGQDFFNQSEDAKAMFEAASDAIQTDMQALLFNENDQLGRSEYTQPAILLVSAIAQKLFFNETSHTPECVLGHSLGEFSALTSVGALSLADAIKTVHHRGQWMQEACEGKDAGMMVVLGLSDDAIESYVSQAQSEGKRIWAANYNCDGQIVLAGQREDLAACEAPLKAAGAKRAMLLDMSVASHCPMLESASVKLKDALESSLKTSFAAPVISNVTAAAYRTKEEAIDLLPKQLISPVRYKHSIMAVDASVDLYIEFGNGSVLKGINRKVTKTPTLSVNDMASLRAAIEALKVEA